MATIDTTKTFRVWNGYSGFADEDYATFEEASDAAKRYHEGRSTKYTTMILQMKGYVKTPTPDYEIVTI